MDIVHMKTLIAVIEESGFTAAAARLGIAKSVCSRRITDLETDLGVQLVNRTTRSVVPTELGREYYESCLDILARIDAATEAAKGANSAISGRLRLAVPSSYTDAVLAAQFDRFAQDNQDVELVLHLSDKRVDLISEGFDAAIRIGVLDDSGLFARKLGTTKIRMYAAPSYLARHGEPDSFDALNDHECIRYNNLTSGSEWVALHNDAEVRKRITGRFSSNSGTYNRNMAIAGRGIAVLPDFIACDAVENGTLVEILKDYAFPLLDINILYPQKRNMPASLRALITHLTETEAQ
ncbi:LysR family transcriptional regulator [Amylibacter sp. IMCC11727]|uniref:LysR family transcriptional regulator n=1 Tax=Amylibacter sp. IMCC11727 TaxID=3039851 RepID=UPI00244DF6EA|nr:LysR family transcriptional regulator [Amylibacter sp. IMCC11727]WGI20361.1 LysR family transcriptional regulator [Amylibacter sp. IMCC11727]